MSGGSWDYAYSKVRTAADQLRDQFSTFDKHGDQVWNDQETGEYTTERPPADELRMRFADAMDKVADAMKAIEWSDSGNTAPDHWRAPVEAIVTAMNAAGLIGSGAPEEPAV